MESRNAAARAGLYAGHPAEPINGISVSDLYPLATAPHDKPWPLPPGAVHPESPRDQLAELRLHPGEADASATLPFVPRAAKVVYDHRFSVLTGHRYSR